jgi:hypothetical protein
MWATMWGVPSVVSSTRWKLRAYWMLRMRGRCGHFTLSFFQGNGENATSQFPSEWKFYTFSLIFRINRAIDNFVAQWNNHGLRTENHRTPLQLFAEESLARCNTSLTSMRDLFNPVHNPLLPPSLAGTRPISAFPCPLPPERLAQLHEDVHPLDEDGQFGTSHFRIVLSSLWCIKMCILLWFEAKLWTLDARVLQSTTCKNLQDITCTWVSLWLCNVSYREHNKVMFNECACRSALLFPICWMNFDFYWKTGVKDKKLL